MGRSAESDVVVKDLPRRNSETALRRQPPTPPPLPLRDFWVLTRKELKSMSDLVAVGLNVLFDRFRLFLLLFSFVCSFVYSFVCLLACLYIICLFVYSSSICLSVCLLFGDNQLLVLYL